MSFSEGMNQCLRTSLPILVLALTFLSISLAHPGGPDPQHAHWLHSGWPNNATESAIDYTRNDLILGFQDTFFWFLVPLFGLICTGVCIAVNYVALILTHVFSILYGQIGYLPLINDGERNCPVVFTVTSPRRRIITTSILLLMVSTVIPYHFAYMVLCIVQISTCTRAYRVARDTRSEANYNFYNYAHSVLLIMLWILPINMPVLVVWIRNLMIHWLTPFSSHHNILSILPIILLVETLSTGRMIPRVTTRIRYLTNLFFFSIALYAAVYGVTYAYLLHQLVNILCLWLVVIHFSGSFTPHPSGNGNNTTFPSNPHTISASLSRLSPLRIIETNGGVGLSSDGRSKKRP